MSAKIDDSFPSLETTVLFLLRDSEYVAADADITNGSSRLWCRWRSTRSWRVILLCTMTMRMCDRKRRTTRKTSDVSVKWASDGERRPIWMNETFSFAMRCAFAIRTIRRLRADRRIWKRPLIDGRCFQGDFCREDRGRRVRRTNEYRVTGHSSHVLEDRPCCDDVELQRHAKHNDLVTITRSLMCWIEVTMTRMSTARLE